MNALTFVTLIVIILSIIHNACSHCSINIKTDLNRTVTGTVKEPVFLKFSGNEYKLMIPDDEGILTFKTGDSALVACTSDQKPNTLTFNNKSSSTILCLDGNTFSVNHQRSTVTEFNECNLQVNGNTMNLNQKCAGNGSLINIGFQLGDSRGFVTLISVCYNKKRGSSIYTKHIIQGRAIKNAMKSNTRPSNFKTAEVSSNIDAPKSFTKSNQLKRLEEIFNDREKAVEHLNKTFLARGHLSPDGDFLFVSWQFTSYYYINTIPQWQSINNGNWKHVESVVRTKADKVKDDLIIFTGGFDVLKLNNKKISLEPDGLDVPKWSWKIVKHQSEDSGIAFATFNNPFASSAPNALCQDICSDNGWDWKERKTFSKGYTICCSVSDLMNAVSTIPNEAKASKVLQK